MDIAVSLSGIVVHEDVLDIPEELGILPEALLELEEGLDELYGDPLFSISYFLRTHLIDRSLRWRPSASSTGISLSTVLAWCLMIATSILMTFSLLRGGGGREGANFSRNAFLSLC